MRKDEMLCVRWKDFQNNLSLTFNDFMKDKEFFDVTLSVGSQQLQAHKIILAANSPFFRKILLLNPHPHPLLYLKCVELSVLESLMCFIYQGEVKLSHQELPTFLALAEELQIKGLSQSSRSTESDPSPILSPKIEHQVLDSCSQQQPLSHIEDLKEQEFIHQLLVPEVKFRILFKILIIIVLKYCLGCTGAY